MIYADEHFLLHSEAAKTLYHEYAKSQPIFDYHSHLSPQDIAENRRFSDLSAIWLERDHYKWRAMRTLGLSEHLISGAARPREKFQAFAEAVPHFLGNPLYHWSHLELKRAFGIDDILLSAETAGSVWERANACLSQPECHPRGILERMQVRMVGTTDDPCDTLEYHQTIAADSNFSIRIAPTFRPDHALAIEHADFPAYMIRLEQASGITIRRFSDLLSALDKRLAHFAAHGAIAADHGIGILRYAQAADETALDIILQRRFDGHLPEEREIAQFQTALLIWLGAQYHRRGLVMQLHIGALRNTNTRKLRESGPDSGFDSIGDRPFATPLAALLDAMEKNDALPKTILYHINECANPVLATMCGNFQQQGIRGKIQFGSGWWFNDQKDGMIAQLTTHAQMGILSVFVGMLTDSRSFLSFTRHEYFRRILCNLIGEWVRKGEAPNDMALLGQMVRDICFGNAERYFSTDDNTDQ